MAQDTFVLTVQAPGFYRSKGFRTFGAALAYGVWTAWYQWMEGTAEGESQYLSIMELALDRETWTNGGSMHVTITDC